MTRRRASGAVVEIGALEFDGFDEAEARRAAAAFEEALTDLLDRHGLPEGVHLGDLGDVELEDLPADATTPEAQGRALARALYRRVAQ